MIKLLMVDYEKDLNVEKELEKLGVKVIKECDEEYLEDITTQDIFHIAKEYKYINDDMEFLTEADTWTTFDEFAGTEIRFFESRAECVDYAREIGLNSYYVYTLEDFKR